MLMKTTIDITSILGVDIKSRVSAQDFRQYIINTGAEDVVVDFGNVKFATRSFLDEFYNLFLKDGVSTKVKVVNMPEDLEQVLCAVKNTQYKPKSGATIGDVTRCETIDDFRKCLSSITL